MTIDENECIALYAFLKNREESLGPELEKLLRRVEGVVFDRLSIDEVERLTEAGRGEIVGGKS